MQDILNNVELEKMSKSEPTEFEKTIQNIANIQAEWDKQLDTTEILQGTPKEPVIEPPTQKELYDVKVKELIHNKYCIDDEIQCIIEKDSEPIKFNEYRDYVQQCKEQAHREVYGQ